MRELGLFMMGCATGLALGGLIVAVVFSVRGHRNHIHEWSPWTGWVGLHSSVDMDTWWKRERRCRTCGRVGYERAGRHTCFASAEHCPHYDNLAVMFDEDYTVKKMERDMGMGGQGD